MLSPLKLELVIIDWPLLSFQFSSPRVQNQRRHVVMFTAFLLSPLWCCTLEILWLLSKITHVSSTEFQKRLAHFPCIQTSSLSSRLMIFITIFANLYWFAWNYTRIHTQRELWFGSKGVPAQADFLFTLKSHFSLPHLYYSRGLPDLTNSFLEGFSGEGRAGMTHSISTTSSLLDSSYVSY